MVESRSALLIIDVQVDFFTQHAELSARRADLVAKINALSRAFRSKGQPVVWVRQEFAADLSDAFLEMRRKDLRITITGTEGCRLLPELECRGSDHVIVKKRYSAFFQTELDELLESLRTEALVVAGINTHACVRTSVIDAYQRDLDVILASECIASHDTDHHHVTLRYLDGKMTRLLDNSEIYQHVLADAA